MPDNKEPSNMHFIAYMILTITKGLLCYKNILLNEEDELEIYENLQIDDIEHIFKNDVLINNLSRRIALELIELIDVLDKNKTLN